MSISGGENENDNYQLMLDDDGMEMLPSEATGDGSLCFLSSPR